MYGCRQPAGEHGCLCRRPSVPSGRRGAHDRRDAACAGAAPGVQERRRHEHAHLTRTPTPTPTPTPAPSPAPTPTLTPTPTPNQSAGTYIKPLFNAEATLEALLDEANTLEALTLTLALTNPSPIPSPPPIPTPRPTPSPKPKPKPSQAAGGAITSGGHGLRTWQWKDLYQQRHAEIEGFLSHPEVAQP